MFTAFVKLFSLIRDLISVVSPSMLLFRHLLLMLPCPLMLMLHHHLMLPRHLIRRCHLMLPRSSHMSSIILRLGITMLAPIALSDSFIYIT
jgi:hypothetical protein